MRYKIPVLLGTTRIGCKSEHVANYALNKLKKIETVNTELIDLASFNLPVFEERMSSLETIPEGLITFSKKIVESDALIIVTPEYKNSYPGALKNAFDFLEAGIFKHKPIAICTVSSGGFGGVNCLSQLRLVCLAMGGVPLPGKLPVSNVKEVFDDKGQLTDFTYDERIQSFLEELLWYTEALTARKKND